MTDLIPENGPWYHRLTSHLRSLGQSHFSLSDFPDVWTFQINPWVWVLAFTRSNSWENKSNLLPEILQGRKWTVVNKMLSLSTDEYLLYPAVPTDLLSLKFLKLWLT